MDKPIQSATVTARRPASSQSLYLPKRPFLLSVRIGNGSLFESWFQSTSARSWDLHLSCYAETPYNLISHAELVSTDGLSKMSSIKELYDQNQTYFDQYRFLWFLDDDIKLEFRDIDKFFEIMSQMDLLLAQPALSLESPKGHRITEIDAECVMRHTNFVEVMMPAFSQEAFRRCVNTFDESISGWGLDYIWPKLLDYRGVAIVDAVVAEHTKSLDEAEGAFYRYLRGIGIDHREEWQQLTKRYALDDNSIPRNLSRIRNSEKGSSTAVGANIFQRTQDMVACHLNMVQKSLLGELLLPGARANQQGCGSRGTSTNLKWLCGTILAIDVNNTPGDFIEISDSNLDGAVLMTAALRCSGSMRRILFAPSSRSVGADEFVSVQTEALELFHAYNLPPPVIIVSSTADGFADQLRDVTDLAIIRVSGAVSPETVILWLEVLHQKLISGGYCICDPKGSNLCAEVMQGFRKSRGIDAPVVNLENGSFYWRKI